MAAHVHTAEQLARRYANSRALRQRAERLIPGGGHLSGRPLIDADTSPLYFERARGAHIWDVDGNDYLDYVLAFGVHVLGHADDDVDAAAREAEQRGRLMSMNHPLHVELVERLVERFVGMEMGTFFKTGSEATTAAVRIARRHSGKRKILRAGYHGWHDWCLPLESFVPSGLGEQVLEFRADDPDSVRTLLERDGSDVAAVILAPEMVVPFSVEVLQEIRRLTHVYGVLLIMDEVKTGLRCAPDTLSRRASIVPDLLTLSKALGNGFPIAVTLGTRRVMACAAGLHVSATYHGETPAMAAALRVLELLDARHVQQHIAALGTRLIDGLNRLAQRHDLPATAFGEPVPEMPFMRFRDPRPERNEVLSRTFYQEMFARGVLLHPRHMWFLSGAHTERDIERTLDVAEEAFEVTASVRAGTIHAS